MAGYYNISAGGVLRYWCQPHNQLLGARMDAYQNLMVKVLDHIQYLKFDRTHPWHRHLICLYCSIVEYSDTLISLDKEVKNVAIPLVARALLEAYVDLVNLSENKEYGYNLEAGFIHEWLRVTNEAGKLENPYLEGLAVSESFDEQVAQWNANLEELKKKGYGKLNRFEKFRRAGMENEYRSIYNFLCSYSHNNIRALNDRYIEVSDDETDFKVTMFKEREDDENEQYLSLGLQYLHTSSQIIHRKLETGYEGVFDGT